MDKATLNFREASLQAAGAAMAEANARYTEECEIYEAAYDQCLDAMDCDEDFGKYKFFLNTRERSREEARIRLDSAQTFMLCLLRITGESKI